MATIRNIRAREILDSRGNPTISVEVTLSDGTTGVASVPSGASTGKYEAVELRDRDKDRFNGLGVLKAVKHVNTEIASEIKGLPPEDQQSIDKKMIELDGTPNKSRLGANAILGVSLAIAHAAANQSKEPLYRYLQPSDKYMLPVPMLNILNGGKHAADSTDLQEFMVVPAVTRTFADSLKMGTEIYHLYLRIKPPSKQFWTRSGRRVIRQAKTVLSPWTRHRANSTVTGNMPWLKKEGS
jgi:enolase